MLKRVALGLVILVGGVALLFGAAFAYAQTETARGQISGLIENTLSTEQQTAEVQGLGGLLPFDVRLGRFRLSDDQGVWLEVDDVRVDLSARDLLAGRLVLRELGAERIALERLPATVPALPEAEPDREQAPFEPPRLPDRFRAFAVERLYVNRIELGQAVAGEAAVFTLDGTARTDDQGQRLDARIDLVRTDEATANANLQAVVDLTARQAEIRLTAEETGGLLAGLTGRPEAGAFRLALNGAGPLSDWRATLEAEAEALARLDADLGLAVDGPPRIDLTGTLVAAEGVLPVEVAPLAGQQLDIRVRGGQQDQNLITLDELRLAGGGFALTGEGRGDLQADTVEGRIDLEVPALDAASGLAGTPLGGSAGLNVVASGALRQPDLTVSLAGRELRADTITVRELTSNLVVAFLGPLDQGYQGVRVSGTGGASGLTLNGEPLRPEDTLSFELAATVPAEGVANVERLNLEGQHLQASAPGSLDQQTLAGQGHVELAVADVAALTAALGPDAPEGLAPAGSLSLAADLTVEEQARRILADFDARGELLSGLPPGAQELLGGSPSATGRADIVPGERVGVADLDLAGQGARVTGSAALGLADESLSGDLQLELPDLALLEPVAGQPLGGRLEAHTRLAGSMSHPEVTLDATATDLAAAGQQFQRVTLAGTAAGPVENLAGELRLGVAQAQGELTLATVYTLAGQRLGLDGLRLEGPATQVTGNLALDLATPLATGRLAGGIGDLAALAPWHGQANLTGQVQLTADLTAPNGRQDAAVTVDASTIAGDFGTVRTARAQATVRDALGAGTIDGEAVVDGFAQPGLVVEQARLTATGALGDLQVALEAEGQQIDRFDVAARARLMILEEPRRVELQSLAGTFAGQRIELGSPATLVLDQGVLDLDQLDLRIGQARIQGNLDMQGGRVRGAARVSDFDLAWLARLGGPELQGIAHAELGLSGSTAAPSGSLTVRVPALAPGGADFRTIPPVAFRLDAALQGQRLQAGIDLADLTERPITAELALPIRFSLEPFAFELPEDGALVGRVDAQADLARLGALAQLDGQRLGGRLDAALRLDGTLARPQVGGRVQIQNGLVEDAATGALFRDIELVATGTDRRLVIERFRAVDRRTGTITGQGQLEVDLAADLPYRVETRLQGAEVLRNDLGTVTLTGDLVLGGDRRRGQLSGTLTVDRADLRIPEGGGVTIADFPVEEVFNGGVRRVPGQPPVPPFAADLDLRVQIPSRLFVRGRGLDSEWGGNLTVTGSAASPTILGSVEYRRGFLDLLDRRFQLRQGTIAFDGGTVPDLDLEAAAQGEDVLAIARLTGPANQPRFELDSEPSLPQDEILAQLLFGRDVRQITPAQGLRLAAALRTLEGGGGDLLGGIRSRLGLDTLDIGDDLTGGPTARAGRYLSENVYLELQRGLTDGTSRARVEVELTRSLSLTSQVGDQSQTSVGVEWKMDY
ncbi:MAG TPA: translocation/assembly module TamB domain-containing protein [Geminicoccaceae bacterium]|nr:translocation/assembly module TamB domain-containing protein [Geminicoccaceae bacterium]